MLASAWQAAKRDKIYVALLLILISLFTVTWFTHKNQKAKDGKSHEPVLSEQLKQSDLDEKIRQAQPGAGFSYLMMFMLLAMITGIGMLAVRVHRWVKRKRGTASIEEYIRTDEYKEQVKTVLCPWSLWDVMKILIVFFTAYLTFFGLQELIITLSGISRETAPMHFLMVLDMVFAEVVAIFFLFRIIRHGYDVSIRQFGLQLNNLFRQIRTGVYGYFMFLPVYLVIVLIVSNISRILGIELKAQEVLTMLVDKDNFTPFQLYVMIAFVAVIGPIFEEIFFRGFLYRAFKKYFGRAAGLTASAVLFAMIHNNLMAFFPIVGLGIMLGILVDKTSSLIPSIVMHILVNSVSLLMVLSLTGA